MGSIPAVSLLHKENKMKKLVLIVILLFSGVAMGSGLADHRPQGVGVNITYSSTDYGYKRQRSRLTGSWIRINGHAPSKEKRITQGGSK